MPLRNLHLAPQPLSYLRQELAARRVHQLDRGAVGNRLAHALDNSLMVEFLVLFTRVRLLGMEKEACNQESHRCVWHDGACWTDQESALRVFDVGVCVCTRVPWSMSYTWLLYV